MKFYATKQNNAIYPSSGYDAGVFEKWPNGKELLVKATESRNYKNHQRFWAFLQVLMSIEKIADKWVNEENLRFILLTTAGYFDWVPGVDGEAMVKVHSMSFENMDEVKFNEVFSKCIDVALEMLPDYCKEDLDEMAEQIAGFG